MEVLNMDTKNFSSYATDTKKVESYLLDLLRGTSADPVMTAYAVSYVIVKSSQVDTNDLSTIDAFISSCSIGKDIEMFLRDKLGLSINPTNLEKVGESVDYLLENSPEYEKRIEEIANEYIYNLGTSAEVGGRFIIEELQRLVLEKQEMEKTNAGDNTSSRNGQKA